MSQPFVGEIRMFAGNFAPRGWAYCDGQLLAVSQNEALFSLLGTNYGGDGRTTFAVPDMRGRLPVHMGTGPGLSPRPIGQRLGSESTKLTSNQMAKHSHNFQASGNSADKLGISGNVLAKTPGEGLDNPDNFYASSETDQQVELMPGTIQPAVGDQPHYNMMPYLCVHFIIALAGVYPSRT